MNRLLLSTIAAAGLCLAAPAFADQGTVTSVHVGNGNRCIRFTLTDMTQNPPAFVGNYAISLYQLVAGSQTNNPDMLAAAQRDLVIGSLNHHSVIGITAVNFTPYLCGNTQTGFFDMNSPPGDGQ